MFLDNTLLMLFCPETGCGFGFIRYQVLRGTLCSLIIKYILKKKC